MALSTTGAGSTGKVQGRLIPVSFTQRVWVPCTASPTGASSGAPGWAVSPFPERTTMLLQWLRRTGTSAARRPSRRPAKSQFQKLQVEPLEDRTTPVGLVAAYGFD